MSKPYCNVFYAGQLLISFEDNASFNNWRRMQPNCWPEVYNGGYVYRPTDQTWWRMDITPVLIEDVPKEIRMQALLLT